MSSRKYRVLLMGRDRILLGTLRDHLQDRGFRVRTHRDGEKTSQTLSRFAPDLILSEVGPEGIPTDRLLRLLRKESEACKLVLLADGRSVEQAVEALKAGATDYLTKPVDLADLDVILEKVRQDGEARDRLRRLHAKLERNSGFGPFVGTSPAMRKIYRLIKVLAPRNAPVLIVGESGTGKELVAQMLRDLGKRRNHPFVTVNAAAIPGDIVESHLFGHEKGAFTGATGRQAGCFEMADGGTLFLDEISEMSPDLQPKLLRVLETKKVRRLGGSKEFQFDVRVLAATNRDLREALRKKILRKDLYYRLSVFTIELPPLRDRPSDIELLALHFVRRFNEKHGRRVQGIGEDALETMQSYPWPGNVRELSNVIERAVVLSEGDWIRQAQLPRHLDGQPLGPEDRIVLPVGISLAEAEERVLRKTLHFTEFNKSEAARILGINVKTVRHKIRTYKIPEP